MNVLGVSGSLRGARHGVGSGELVADLAGIRHKTALGEYFTEQTRLIVEDFFASGRTDNRPFDETYNAFRKLPGRRGLSNTEVALAAALWGASQVGASIDHLSLSSHFLPIGTIRHENRLRSKLIAADAIVVSSPVYFGDRGSLVQSFIDYVAANPELRHHVVGKVYGGVAVGAKRNGGQETTLIYQLLDMANLGLLGVGDSSDTAAQYGGTVVAGDVGTAHKDQYGIDASISTGRRVATVAELLRLGRRAPALRDTFRIAVWILQRDREGTAQRMFEDWAEAIERRHPGTNIELVDVAAEPVVRCIACDICPTSIGPRESYRCIISDEADFFVRHHASLLQADAILVAGFSPQDRTNVVSVYQQFIERTRYLRRDDYVFSNVLTAPFVISELEARQNLHVRMMTSMVRHQTVLHHPLVGMLHDGALLNANSLQRESDRFVETGRTLLLGRLLAGSKDQQYRPIGYQISAAKSAADADQRLGRQSEERERAALVSQQRLAHVPSETE